MDSWERLTCVDGVSEHPEHTERGEHAQVGGQAGQGLENGHSQEPDKACT
jgi:hypothetical protein